VLIVQVPGDGNSDDSKEGFCEEFTAAVQSLPLLPYENLVRSQCGTGEGRCMGLILYRRIVTILALLESALPYRTFILEYCVRASSYSNPAVGYTSVSQPPGRGPVPGPGIKYTGPREFVILVF
jgi:hypothetical protein